MIYLVLALVALGVVAALTTLHAKDGGDTQPVPPQPTCGTCTGGDSRCEQDCMLEAATREIEYYDDEELDRFRGRPSDGYTDDEVREFADVLYTLRPDDVAGWSRSLVLRGVNLPDPLKDELIMLIDR
ncbi:MAG: hypothetical protein SOX17_09030 [Prevotella sp.]|nr:hypothetical protein [Prevotella sp.]MDD7605803.1 hypothetical protein [Prevotellaceae bacterium]MDY3248620.1 hypothetical protein [Prevotella sp.]